MHPLGRVLVDGGGMFLIPLVALLLTLLSLSVALFVRSFLCVRLAAVVLTV